MTDHRAAEIIKECDRQFESCNHTVPALYAWIREMQVWRITFIIVPIILGSIGSLKMLFPEYIWTPASAIATLLVGLFPAIFKALDLDVSIKSLASCAHRFETLRDRFRQCANIWSAKPFDEFEGHFLHLMEQMDDARADCPAIPERHFLKGKKKRDKGHYDFEVDSKPTP